MKSAKYILIGSLVVNAALATVFFARNKSEGSSAAQNLAALTESSSAPAAKWLHLTKETAGNDSALVARLRAEGFPPSVVGAIISARVSEHFTAQRRSLEAAAGEYSYWKSWSSINSSNPEARAALRKIYREQADLQRQLLGDVEMKPYEKARHQNQYGNLSREKAQQLEMIARDYQDLIQQAQKEARGLLLPEDKAKLAYLNKEQQADMAALLTPAELEDYELRSSRTAQQLKARLLPFDATEPEYLALYRLQKAFDDNFSSPVMFGETFRTREESKARSEAQGQLNKAIEAALGPDRYKDYKITTDFDYRRVSQLAERLNLPATTARSVVALKIETDERVKALRSNRTLDKQQRETQLAAIAQTVTTQLTQQLGPDGFSAYRESGGYWLKNLTPNQAPSIETR